jgi:DNA-binding transcriptional ArsR family regulator
MTRFSPIVTTCTDQNSAIYSYIHLFEYASIEMLLTQEIALTADPKDVRRAATIFKVLSHPSRLTIVCRLFRTHGVTQKELIEELGWPQSTMARHIGQLRDRGLIEATRQGTEIKLELAGEVTKNLMSAMCDWVHPETGDQFTPEYRQSPEVNSI